jgi:NAD(P)-dependent dehydrogenase (short-subunit alcohol dehydrogenase family)
LQRRRAGPDAHTRTVDNAGTEYVELSLRNYPMPRLCAPEDVAKAVVFLASDDASYINAEALMVDGGATVYMANARLHVTDNRPG